MDSYTAYRIIMGFIGSTLAIILGLSVFFMALQHDDFAWQYLGIAGLGVLGEFICCAMYKSRLKKGKNNNENIEKENENEKD